jgi:arylsulfatase A-like enzyme
VPKFSATGSAGCLLPVFLLACATSGKRAEPTSSAAFAAEVEAPAARIVLVSIDTLRADYVGSYGAAGARTGTLDGLAQRGTRFETAIAPTPLTLPSHTSLLTGLDPPHHGVHANGTFELRKDIPTLAERLRDAGFETAAFVAAAVLDRRYGLARGFDHYDDEMGFGRTVPGSGGVAERRADEVLDRTLDWMGDAPDRFFLWVHLYDPHASYQPPPAFARKPSGSVPDLEKVGLLKFAAVRFPPLYAGEIHYTDVQLRRLVRTVERRWQDGRTLFVVTSDHGESLGEHGELTHSLSVYDAAQRIPLIMAGPRVPTGRVVDAPVRLIDVAPTVLAIADAAPLPGATGVDLSPWLRGERSDPLAAYVETLSTQIEYGWSPILGVRTERFKYLRSTRPELYDLIEDPGELRDLSGAQPAVVSELDARLDTRIARALPVEMRPLPTSEERAQLESLGYLVPSTAPTLPSLGSVGGPDPKDRRGAIAKIMEARSNLAAGRPEVAAAALADAPEAGGWVAHTRALIALELGDDAMAERESRKMIEAQPAYAEGYMTLARALESQGRLDEANSAWAQATRVDPTQSDSIVASGQLAERRGDTAAAIAHYEAALATRSPHVDAALWLAALEFERGRSNRAVNLLAPVDDLSRANPAAVIRVARAEAAAGRPAKALARVRMAIRGSTNPRVYLEIRDELKTAIR